MNAAEHIKIIRAANTAAEEAHNTRPKWVWNITGDDYPLYIEAGIGGSGKDPRPYFLVGYGGSYSGRDDLVAGKMGNLKLAQWETILEYRRKFEAWVRSEIDTDDMPASTP